MMIMMMMMKMMMMMIYKSICVCLFFNPQFWKATYRTHIFQKNAWITQTYRHFELDVINTQNKRSSKNRLFLTTKASIHRTGFILFTNIEKENTNSLALHISNNLKIEQTMINTTSMIKYIWCSQTIKGQWTNFYYVASTEV